MVSSDISIPGSSFSLILSAVSLSIPFEILTSDCSFVTSGDYERYYEADDGKRYHHIIDPSTLYPSTLYRSVSIITTDSSAADCLSTSLFTLSIEEGKKVLQEYEKDTGNHADAIWILSSDNTETASPVKQHMGYTIAYTDGLEDSIIWED